MRKVKKLSQEKCVACRRDAPQVTKEEAKEFQAQVPKWKVIQREGIKRLTRTFKFDNFLKALEFTNGVGEIAEQEGHHPAILTEWGQVTITWWTHKIRGLHRNDFVMAAKTDQTYLN